MNKKNIFIAFILMTFGFNLIAQEKIRIACVGNSITYGSGIVNREKNSYPAQLQAMLGTHHQVMNFGVSGTTLLKKGNAPYWNTPAYKKALESRPDVVFIKLGTNYSKLVNRAFYAEFENDYKDLIKSFQAGGANPRIVLLLPIPSLLKDSTSIYDPVIKNQIIPRVRKVAYDMGVEVIDLYALFTDKASLLPDKIHPSSLGATIIANRLFEVVKLDEKKGYNAFSAIKEDKKLSSFYGFECADFTFNNRACKVVKPRKAVAGLPWVWRARFWGHEPQADIALLERGFHVVYCDVAELFGNREAIDIWDKFYNYMQKLGLSKKVALEGMSRGGVYVYNWAARYPNRVACVYADAPVLDLKSWPGGKGSGKGSASDWELFKKDYQFTTEEDAAKFKGSPIDKAKEIVKGKFPMLHVVGDADDVVPVAENTAIFEEKVKAAGGDIRVIHKPGVGHHPHSLANPSPIVDFILKATGQKINFAAIPAPGAEYREGAGWSKGKDWWAQHNDIDSLLGAEKNLDILFLGNSITQGTGGHRTYVTYKPGLTAFDSVFVNLKWECAGISGDKTQNVLWRLQNGNYAKAKPKVMVIMIGVNNISAGDSPAEVAAGIKEITDWTSTNMPSTKVLLLGPLPVGLKKDDERRKKYEGVHRLLAKQPHRNFRYEMIAEPFMLPNGDLDPSKYGSDGIHLLPGGYKAWAIALKPTIDQLLNKNK